jgi:hypothetical protein
MLGHLGAADNFQKVGLPFSLVIRRQPPVRTLKNIRLAGSELLKEQEKMREQDGTLRFHFSTPPQVRERSELCLNFPPIL